MYLNKFATSMLATAALVISCSANATPTQSTGNGSAVTTVDLSANFDGLRDGASANFTDGGLQFSPAPGYSSMTCQQGACGNHVGFTNMSGGIYYYVGAYAEVKGAKDEVFMGFETVVGTGYGGSTLHGIWETWLDNVRTGTGSFDAAVGTVIGLRDLSGFDMVRIGTNQASSTNTAFDNSGATAIDSVRMQLQANEVPEPGSLALFGLGLAAAAFGRKRAALRK
jgi:hypothetical protein